MRKPLAALLIILAVVITEGRGVSALAAEAKSTQANSSASDCSAPGKISSSGHDASLYCASQWERRHPGASMADATGR